jgi:uncharacterized protein YdhG (YjbR/CyaY superfamily)
VDQAVQEYVEALDGEHRRLFERIHGLVVDVVPDVEVGLSYRMPTYRANGRRLYVAGWTHGLSIYGWAAGGDGGFTERHPGLKSHKGTIKLRPEDLAGLPDDELRSLIAAVLDA